MDNLIRLNSQAVSFDAFLRVGAIIVLILFGALVILTIWEELRLK